MTGISASTGLISGIDIGGLVDAIIEAERASVRRLEKRLETTLASQAGLDTLQASLLTLATSAQQFQESNTFATYAVANSDPAQLTVTPRDNAAPGSFQLQAIQKATTHQLLARGFANSDLQTFGTDATVTISSGGGLSRPTRLELLNSGAGVRRGLTRITDRSGNSADVDFSHALTVDDVLDEINQQTEIAVTATTVAGQIVLTDESGQTAADLSVADLNGGHAAEDLGIRKSVSAGVLNGDSVYAATTDFGLAQINDGNTLRRLEGAPDLSITLSDSTVLDVNLDGAATIGDVIQAIEQHEDNGGKLTATLVDGRLELTDTSGGAGTLTVEDGPNSTVVRALGLDRAVVGDTLTGARLVGGLNSVLLRNVRGGQGIDEIGQISLTDRSGATATVDLTGAESLDEVIHAINTATTGGGGPLALAARIDDAGTGIVVTDTSGATANNLQIADVGSGTLAAQLGIAADTDQAVVASGSLTLRHVNEATSLETYAPDGGAVAVGSFAIVDSVGNEAVINVTSAVKNLGDLIDRIELADNVSVTARLNDTGDGIVLIDEAGGGEPLEVKEVGGTTAADLRLLGAGEIAGDGKYHLESRRATILDIEADDTLDSFIEKLEDSGSAVTASTIDTGSPINPIRLVLTSPRSGAAGRLIIDDGGLGLDLATLTAAEDAVLSVGTGAQPAFLVASPSGTFENPVPGYDVTVHQAGAAPAQIDATLDFEPVSASLSQFVSNYNKFLDTAAELTQFDLASNVRGVLQGNNLVLRAEARVSTVVNQFSGEADDPIRSLADVGVRFDEGGRLVFDEERLETALRDHPDEVAELFLDEETGVGKRLDEVVDSLTDSVDGSFVIESESLQATADQFTARIDDLELLLDSRRVRLLREFQQMEQTLSLLQSQQEALSSLSNLAASSGAG